ncbi:MAG: HlyC/CorC family transporter [Candidatus Hydrogenedentes bacterium]|jgi:putative hemolysin|nr:HlyC/CorC family transporter [Candidatus Hydrogenedentota bacterium]
MAALFIFLVSILFCAFFAGYETGFVSANLFRIRHLAEKEQNTRAIRLAQRYENPNRLITMLLVGTNLSMVIGTTALTHSVGAAAASFIATPAFLIFAEIMPKSVFRHFPTRLALALFPVVRFFEGFFSPIIIPIAWLSQGFLRLVKQNARGLRMLLASLDDVRVLVDESHDQGTLDPYEHELIHSVFDLQTHAAKEVMVPRIRILAVPETATRSELTRLFIEGGQTRLPVYRGSIDQVIGIVNAFDLIKDVDPENQDIEHFIRPVLHVPDTMKLDDVLNTMRRARQSMAIVTDEYGGTDGLITVEDILEEIFGEIHDEYDVLTTQIRKVGPRAFIIDARTPLDEFTKAVPLQVEPLDVETVGGWVNHVAGHIPTMGEVIHTPNFRILVLEGAPTHVTTIRLELADQPAPSAENTKDKE